MVKKPYGIRTERYKLMHFYYGIDTWEFFDLKKNSKEISNVIDDPSYADVVVMMHAKLDSVQKHYRVTEGEFERAPKEKVNKAYLHFKRLRRTPIK